MKKLGEPLLHGPRKVLERARLALLAERFRPVITQDTLRVSRSGLRRARKVLSAAGIRKGLVSDLERIYGYCYNCRGALRMGANWCKRCRHFVGDAHAM